MGDPPSSCLIQLTLKLLPLLWKRASSLGVLGSPTRERTRKNGWLETRQWLLRCRRASAAAVCTRCSADSAERTFDLLEAVIS